MKQGNYEEENELNILLCCSAGMSTSLLVNKMEKAASQEGVNAKIQAVATTEVRNHINDVDVVLLGPQVRYLLNDIREIGDEKGVPVDTINPMHYGSCNGKEVLKAAIQLMSK
ncbi:PTS sugar transporter subunit IIB [Peribacillus muralis]|uniref:PTS sugar transporter subunit IIB n=1 Tax=Peribacillus muralis TaxID=264697 RepID=UPI003D008177